MVFAFIIHPADNVATLLQDTEPGEVYLRGATNGSVKAREKICQPHKIAIREIACGQQIIKYGYPIGHSTKTILPGEWVHLHNCASNYDARSNTLDHQTGAPTDTAYV